MAKDINNSQEQAGHRAEGKGTEGIFLLDKLTGFSEYEIFTADFFIKHFRMILFCVAMTLIYINNRYAHDQQVKQINNLKTELQDIKYEALTRSSELMDMSRSSQVKELVRKQGVALEESNRPAYNLNH